jgi:hypothetical protein
MDSTQGNIVIVLLVIIVALVAGKRITWLRYDTGGASNGTEHEINEGETQTAKSTSRPSLKIEPKPMSA